MSDTASKMHQDPSSCHALKGAWGKTSSGARKYLRCFPNSLRQHLGKHCFREMIRSATKMLLLAFVCQVANAAQDDEKMSGAKPKIRNVPKLVQKTINSTFDRIKDGEHFDLTDSFDIIMNEIRELGLPDGFLACVTQLKVSGRLRLLLKMRDDLLKTVPEAQKPIVDAFVSDKLGDFTEIGNLEDKDIITGFNKCVKPANSSTKNSDAAVEAELEDEHNEDDGANTDATTVTGLSEIVTAVFADVKRNNLSYWEKHYNKVAGLPFQVYKTRRNRYPDKPEARKFTFSRAHEYPEFLADIPGSTVSMDDSVLFCEGKNTVMIQISNLKYDIVTKKFPTGSKRDQYEAKCYQVTGRFYEYKKNKWTLKKGSNDTDTLCFWIKKPSKCEKKFGRMNGIVQEGKLLEFYNEYEAFLKLRGAKCNTSTGADARRRLLKSHNFFLRSADE